VYFKSKFDNKRRKSRYIHQLLVKNVVIMQIFVGLY